MLRGENTLSSGHLDTSVGPRPELPTFNLPELLSPSSATGPASGLKFFFFFFLHQTQLSSIPLPPPRTLPDSVGLVYSPASTQDPLLTPQLSFTPLPPPRTPSDSVGLVHSPASAQDPSYSADLSLPGPLSVLPAP